MAIAGASSSKFTEEEIKEFENAYKFLERNPRVAAIPAQIKAYLKQVRKYDDVKLARFYNYSQDRLAGLNKNAAQEQIEIKSLTKRVDNLTTKKEAMMEEIGVLAQEYKSLQTQFDQVCQQEAECRKNINKAKSTMVSNIRDNANKIEVSM